MKLRFHLKCFHKSVHLLNDKLKSLKHAFQGCSETLVTLLVIKLCLKVDLLLDPPRLLGDVRLYLPLVQVVVPQVLLPQRFHY